MVIVFSAIQLHGDDRRHQRERERKKYTRNEREISPCRHELHFAWLHHQPISEGNPTVEPELNGHLWTFLTENRDLKQTRTATAVHKQLNFTVKNKPHTTNYIYCIYEAYFMIKSV